ncbi:hypothetical protein PDE_06206 [Penicillium oxalicum 114-2]|uniref:Carrier domain-containing protein n=1 Tax=Penicillium oxalicum (strain 114-2 / CGMCC 5302) TaxID=933388 RepID=S7ZRG7_PENO1|nr:hypothetical protein PDE_06206 [Penicillium oxalicum 114-2]
MALQAQLLQGLHAPPMIVSERFQQVFPRVDARPIPTKRPGSPDTETELVDLTPIQQEIISALGFQSAWTSFTFEIPDQMAFSIDRLRMTWQAVAAHHPLLRTVIVPSENGNGPYRQRVMHQVIPMVLSAWEPSFKSLPYLVYDEASVGRQTLTIHYHRALIDVKSLHLIWNDFELFFHGFSFPPRIPFTTYAKAIALRGSQEASKFWDSYLQGYSASRLFARNLVAQTKVKTSVHGDVSLLSQVEKFAHEHQVSVKAVFLAGWAVTLSRHLQSHDVAFYTNLRDCSFDPTEYVVGPMDVIAPVRIQLLESETALEAVHRLEGEKRTVSQYSYLGGASIRKHGHIQTSLSSMFTVRESEIPVHNVENPDITTEATLNFATRQLTLVHDSSLSSPRATIILQHFWEAIQQIITSPNDQYQSLRLTSEQENSSLLSFRSSSGNVSPRMVHNLIEEQASSDGNAPALQFELSEFMSFTQLNAAANRVAHRLTGLMSPGTIIPVHMDISVQFVVGLLAILKAGGAYVILDPFQPPSRKAYILNDVKAPFCLTNGGPIEGIADMPAYSVEDLMQNSTPDAENNLVLSLDPEQPAYIIYTSGSTGTPKGVILSHRAASTGILCAPTVPNNRNLLFYNPIFSAAQRTILSTLAKGGCLCLASRPNLQRSLMRLINDMEINSLGITSSTIALLDPEMVPTLQRINLTGESLDPSVVARWANRVELRNNYGLSECTQLTWGRQLCSGEQQSSQNVGQPSDTTSAYILDPDTCNLTPFLVAGELCLEGPQIASGYLNRKEATEKVFVDSPFTPGRKLYRTGDMAIRLEDGTVEIVGRIDFQTKINGQRVEPGEISAFLHQQSLVHAAVVVAATVEEEKVLVACVSPSDTSLSWPQVVSTLRAATLASLPSYMTPAYWLSFDKLPVNHNGKTDVLKLRNKIQAMDRSELISTSMDTEEVQRELSDVEKVLQSVWSKVLSLPSEVVTVNKSFLALGGDSLKALLVISELLSRNYLAELGDILRADSLATAASSLVYQENASAEQDSPAPFSLMADKTDVDRTTFEDVYPATPFQEGVISAHQVAGGYVYHRAFDIEGYDVPRLQQSFQMVINNNAIYRTGFVARGTGFLQMVHRQFTLSWDIVNDTASVDSYVSHVHKQEMDIAQPLIRAAILNGQILVIIMHHVLFDFWSSKFLFQDAAAIYNNRTMTSRLPFNMFVRHYQQRVNEKEASEFWSHYLQNSSATRLTTERMPFNTASQIFRQSLREFSASAGVTPGALMYAVWSIILWKHTGNSDVTFGVTLSGRDAPIVGVQDLNGPTMTTVPVRIQLEPTMSLMKVVDLMQQEIWNVARYSQLGLRRVLKASGQDSSLFDSMVNFLVKSDIGPDATALKPYGERPIWNTGFNSLEVEETMSGEFEIRLSGYMESVRTKFIMEEVVLLLETIVSNGKKSLKDVDIVPPSEALFLQQMSTLPTVTDAKFLHKRFEVTALEAGDRVAIEFEKDEPVSYRELNSRANQWARYLVQQGIGADSLVPVCLGKSVEMITIILAILKAGGGFVPLDPDNPSERNNFIVRDVSATIVLTEESLCEIFEADSGVKVVDIYNTHVSDFADSNLDIVDLEPHNLAYAIYTSGSTGLPKGVLVPHQSIAAGIESISMAESWQPEWRVLQFSNYVFDVSVGDIFCTLGIGATLCMAPMESLLSDLAQVINSMGVNRLFLTPTVAKLIHPTEVPGVKGLYLAGEPVTPDLVEIWTPHCVVMNCYGPTEASILAAAGYIEPGGNARVIGHPLPNCAAMILEVDSLRLAPYGAVGELCLSGPQLARGYLNRPEATANAFVLRGGDRVYRTGDLSRWLQNKRIECFGRKDSQVKINGHRIELGEIESAILKTNQVQHAIVSVVEIQKKMQLAAFCVVDSRNPSGILPAEEYLETLTTVSISLTSLPPYMVPTIWIPVGTLPLLPSGKTNRKKLLEWINGMGSDELQQYSNTGAQAEFVAPVSTEEILLQGLWAGLFHKDASEISSTSPFFAHGGDSISAINLVSKCKGAGYVLAVSDVLAFPLLSDMARRMRPVKKDSTKIEHVSFTASDETYATIAAAGVRQTDIETIYRAPPGVEDFLVRGAKAEQFWQCQTVRPLPSVIDFDRWIEITTELTARNEILRSMWLEADGTWLQVVLSKPVLDLQIIPCESESDKEEKINQTWDKPFEIGMPFIRYRLFVLPDGQRDLLLKIHHAMYDGTLLRIFDDEFKALFKKQSVPETVSFRDYVSYMDSTDREKSLVFWKDLLQDNLSPFPEAKHPISSAMRIATTDRKVDSFAAHCGITVPIVFQTAFSLLLCRLSGRTDVTYDNLITGRNVDMEEAQTIAGTCANFLPFRSAFTEETTIKELLKDTQSLFWITTENGNVSLNDIYGSMNQDRDTSASRALFLFQPFDQAPPTANVVEKHMRWMVMALSKVRMPIDYALHLEVSKTPTGYTLKFKYDPKLYSDDQLDGLMGSFLDILEKMMSHSRSRVMTIV